MALAEARARKVHKTAGADGVERMVNGARLAVLEKALGTPLKRFRTPDKVSKSSRFPGGKISDRENDKDEATVVWKESG